MQPAMLLLDESVQFFIHLERHLLSRKLTRGASIFAQQVSRLRSDVIAFRAVVALGQEAPAAVLARAFIEGVELAMSLVVDPDFSDRYFDSSDHSIFWKTSIGYGKIYPRVEAFLRLAGGTDEMIAERIAHHKATKDALSGHVHAANFSAMRSLAPPLLSHPGAFHIGELGTASAHLPRLCLLIADETQVFSACCLSLLIRPDAPEALKHHKPKAELGDVVASAHVLQTLLTEYGDQLEAHYATFLDYDTSAADAAPTSAT
ncbi:MAG TPA: hypothetical protein DCY64_10925 [Hydrogenophaga sp.]|nr:MAG: hypothetical protein A2X73_23935 [Burkholderiales bacterium GWE1_65_30]OGA91845.1 MAG: hypothetical protein A2X72_07455 [Burkholderiales bacterium GWF1_66_17]HAX20784.1 hypothetical protein [Hydrogenophaga sp.]HBU20593.1 hypothetical protein [Hydrogenophaga sp.]